MSDANDPRSYVIYKHTNRVNGKGYVGWAVVELDQLPEDGMLRRWKGHIYELARGIRLGKELTLFKNAICKYGQETWDHSVLEIITPGGDYKLAEVKHIVEQKTFAYDLDGWGYNETRGGDGVTGLTGHWSGKKFNSEHRANLRCGKAEAKQLRGGVPTEAMNEASRKNGDRLRGKKRSPEVVAAVVAGRLASPKGRGYKLDPEVGRKISQRLKGVPKSDEHREALRLAAQKRKKPGKRPLKYPELVPEMIELLRSGMNLQQILRHFQQRGLGISYSQINEHLKRAGALEPGTLKRGRPRTHCDLPT